jgi:hypothetical protein
MAPPGNGVERNIHSLLDSHLLQLQKVLRARTFTLHSIFILQLNADHRAAIFPEQSLKLIAYLRVVSVNVVKISGIVSSRRAFLEQSGKPPFRASPCA